MCQRRIVVLLCAIMSAALPPVADGIVSHPDRHQGVHLEATSFGILPTAQSGPVGSCSMCASRAGRILGVQQLHVHCVVTERFGVTGQRSSTLHACARKEFLAVVAAKVPSSKHQLQAACSPSARLVLARFRSGADDDYVLRHPPLPGDVESARGNRGVTHRYCVHWWFKAACKHCGRALCSVHILSSAAIEFLAREQLAHALRCLLSNMGSRSQIPKPPSVV